MSRSGSRNPEAMKQTGMSRSSTVLRDTVPRSKAL